MNLAKMFLTVSVSLVTAAAWAADLPRLWAVTGKSDVSAAARSYILPVTHNGFAVEHDEYFRKTVSPIALNADVDFHQATRLIPDEAPACPEPLADTAGNREILRNANAYCRVGESRAVHLKHQIGLLNPMNVTHPSKEETARTDQGIVEAIKTGSFNSLLPLTPSEFGRNNFICDRNDKWIIQMKENLDSGVLFYALGMAHIMQPLPIDPKQCDGLLAHLRNDGFDLSLVT